MQPRTLNGRYRLDDLIGEGGMAVVYRGYDLILGRVVAVKLLRAQFVSDENFLLRFTREAQSAAKLSHPHIANVYDVGHDGDTHYIVMENVNGPNLKDLIRRQGPFTVDGAAFILRQMAEALDTAHRHGLVHRDIKPQNILVDEAGQVKVVDFGIAKGLSDANLTEAGTGMGTVHYVSPEQARGERATPASDIYSTGVVLYEMLTKELPFDADTPVGVAMQHVSAPPPSPIEFNPSIPPEVDAIVLRALAKNPEDRFPTAMALAVALEHWEEGPGASQATRAMADRRRLRAFEVCSATSSDPRWARYQGSRTPAGATVRAGADVPRRYWLRNLADRFGDLDRSRWSHRSGLQTGRLLVPRSIWLGRNIVSYGSERYCAEANNHANRSGRRDSHGRIDSDFDSDLNPNDNRDPVGVTDRNRHADPNRVTDTGNRERSESDQQYVGSGSDCSHTG